MLPFFGMVKFTTPSIPKDVPSPICDGQPEPPVIWIGMVVAPDFSVRLPGVVPPVPVPIERHAQTVLAPPVIVQLNVALPLVLEVEKTLIVPNVMVGPVSVHVIGGPALAGDSRQTSNTSAIKERQANRAKVARMG